MKSDIIQRASKSKPCPVCGSGTKNCSQTADGLHLCRGEPQEGWKCVSKSADSAGFRHYRSAHEQPPRTKPVKQTKTTSPDIAALAKQFVTDLAQSAKAYSQLALRFGLPAEVFQDLPHLGVCRQPSAHWTFPECFAASQHRITRRTNMR
jgi:hypothetical protein